MPKSTLSGKSTQQPPHVKRQVRDHPNDASARDALARALARGGRLIEARNQWERAAEAPAQTAARRALADVERLLQVLRG